MLQKWLALSDTPRITSCYVFNIKRVMNVPPKHKMTRADLSSNIDLISLWRAGGGGEWLNMFNDSKTNLVTFHYLRLNPDHQLRWMHVPSEMSAALSGTLISWNPSLRSIAKDAGKIVGSLCHTSKYMTPRAIVLSSRIPLISYKFNLSSFFCGHQLWGTDSQEDVSPITKIIT